MWSRDISVGIATAYWLDGRVSIPGFGNKYLFILQRPERLCSPQSPQWVPRSLSLGIKLPGCEADHSPPSSAEVKNCGSALPRIYS
jgi:hypothetical protein